jgi:hypothetical protein
MAEHSGSVSFMGAGGLNAEALNNVEEALRKLRPQVQAALLDNAEAELKVVRAEPTSPEKLHRLRVALLKVVERLAIDFARVEMHEAIQHLVKFLSGS